MSKSQEEVLVLPTPTPTLSPQQAAVWEDWEGSQHADTYELEKGPNTYCASCHSPLNWDYQAKIDPAPNCVSCKFSSEEEPRIAAGNPLVPEEDWRDIGCEVCHMMNGREAEAGYYWYDNASGFYEVVISSTELCEKCHMDREPFLRHQRDLGDQVHVGFDCTDCHDPHDPYVSCGSNGCHSDIVILRTLPTEDHIGLTDREQCLECHTTGMDAHSMETQRTGERNCLVCHEYFSNLTEDDLAPAYHSLLHANLECVACHDASGLAVGPTEDGLRWVAFRTIGSPVGQLTEPYDSHNLAPVAACTRCHYPENPWGLPEYPTGETEE